METPITQSERVQRKNKVIQVRCSNTVDKSGKSRTCGGYIASLELTEMRVRCKKCGIVYSIWRNDKGGFTVFGHPKGQHLLDIKEDRNGKHTRVLH